MVYMMKHGDGVYLVNRQSGIATLIGKALAFRDGYSPCPGYWTYEQQVLVETTQAPVQSVKRWYKLHDVANYEQVVTIGYTIDERAGQ